MKITETIACPISEKLVTKHLIMDGDEDYSLIPLQHKICPSKILYIVNILGISIGVIVEYD